MPFGNYLDELLGYTDEAQSRGQAPAPTDYRNGLVQSANTTPGGLARQMYTSEMKDWLESAARNNDWVRYNANDFQARDGSGIPQVRFRHYDDADEMAGSKPWEPRTDEERNYYYQYLRHQSHQADPSRGEKFGEAGVKIGGAITALGALAAASGLLGGGAASGAAAAPAAAPAASGAAASGAAAGTNAAAAGGIGAGFGTNAGGLGVFANNGAAGLAGVGGGNAGLLAASGGIAGGAGTGILGSLGGGSGLLSADSIRNAGRLSGLLGNSGGILGGGAQDSTTIMPTMGGGIGGGATNAQQAPALRQAVLPGVPAMKPQAYERRPYNFYGATIWR